MKKQVLLGLALFGGTLGAQAQLTAYGTPDAYGYTWLTSAAAGGPTYNWLDIRARGTRVQGLDDDNIAPTVITLPFTFPHYLGTYNTISIASNGYLALTYPGGPAAAALAQSFSVIPAVPPNPASGFLAGYLADLTFNATGANSANPGKCYYYLNSDSLIVSYLTVPYWVRVPAGQPDYGGSNSFQIIISRLDSSITYQYLAMDAAPPPPTMQSPNSYLVGMQDQTGTLGLQAGLNQQPAGASAIKFYRPRVTSLQFTDLGANGFGNADGTSIVALLGQPLPVKASVSNVGNRDVASFNVNVKIINRPGGGSQLALNNQTTNVTNLRAQRDTLVTLPNMYTPTTNPPSAGTGVFQVKTKTQLPADINATNNEIISSLIVIDTAAGPTYTISYDDEPSNGRVGFGAGVYFTPPYYPATLLTTEALMRGQDGATAATSGVKVKIYADNGPGGTPGTLLVSDSIAQPDINLNTLNSYNLAQPLSISSGGFYISWVADSSNSLFVGSHTAGGPTGAVPSRRSYEVINDAFATYRSPGDNILITATMKTRTPSGVGVGEDRTGQLILSPAFPNPATDRTTLGFSLGKAAPVTLVVRDMLGRPVRTVSMGVTAAGDHRYELATANLAPGVYTYSLAAGSVKLTRKLVVQ